MTAACSKGSGGIFRKITKNQLNRAGGSKQRGAGVGRLTNHTHATTDTLFKSAGKKGNIFTYFQLNRKWKSRPAEEAKIGRKRKRACLDYHAISVNPKGGRVWGARLFPTCQPLPQPLAPSPSPRQPQLLSPCCVFVLRPYELLMMPTG